MSTIVETNLSYVTGEFGIKLIVQFVFQGAAVDLTGATTLQLNVRWSDGTMETFTATDETLSSGTISYTWLAADLDTPGPAIGQAIASAAGFSRKTKRFRFDLEAALTAQ